MIIVLDTNVLVSGIFWQGPPNKLLNLWESKKFKLAVSLSIIDEYRRVSHELGRKYPKINISEIIDLIVFNSEIYAVKIPNEALLDLNGYGGIRILKPNQIIKEI